MRSSRLSVPRPLYLLATSLLILVLYGGFSTRVEAATPSKASSNQIRVWIVGSPHTGDLPPAIAPTRFRQEVESLGYTIQVETFPARGFAAKFRQALQDHNEPEVLTFDNYGILKGIRTAHGWFDGIASDPQIASSLLMVHESFSSLQPRGWVVLIRSAINYEAAKTFAMRPPICESEAGSAAYSPSIGSAMQQAKEMATFAAHAYLSCDRSALSGISDESRLGRTCFLAESDTQVESLKACRVSGNRNLAFVSLVSTFSSQLRVSPANTGEVYSGNLGKQSILAVLRNQSGVWRLLAITDDSLNTVYRNCLTTLTFDRLLGDESTAGNPDPAQLRTPDGFYPRPMNGERFGDFTWEPNQSPDAIGQVVEFLLGNDVSQGRNRLFFLPARDDKLSSGYVMWIGRSSAWRVWTISKGGDVAFSRQHTYTLDDFLRARKSNLQSQ